MKHFKKIFLSTITTLLLVFSLVVTSTASVSPRYNNVYSASSAVSISDSGLLTISNRYSSNPDTFTKASIITFVEKRVLGLFWVDVDIGEADNKWIDTIYNYSYTGYHSVQLSSTGKYRVTVEYTIYGSGGSADVIPYEIEKNY